MGKIKLIDFFHVSPDPCVKKLSNRDKVKLIDNLVGNPRMDNRGLAITYDLSHSGRRINNRIYTVKGQQDGIRSLLTPYPKPILIHHDGDSDPIGRFSYGEWQDISNEAFSHFSDIRQFNEVQKAFDLDDPERIYEVMKKYNLLTSKTWPGLGRMRVQARITDEKAIEKFLDGRYVTFSAGSTTDRHVCSICQTDWADGDICEHRHGKIYDGELCVFITGEFKVLEGSVVNMPADDLSQVLAMEFTDEPKNRNRVLPNNNTVTKDQIYFSDSVYDIKESYMSDHAVTISEDLVAEEHVSSEISEEQMEVSNTKDTATVESFSDVKSDSTTSEEESTDNATDSKQSEVEEYDISDKETVDSSEEINEDTSVFLNRIVKELSDIREELTSLKNNGVEENVSDAIASEEEEATTEGSDSSDVQETEENQEEEKEVLTSNDTDIVKNEIDWFTLDAALNSLVEAKLSTEDRSKLDASDFCGPDRLFPVPDCAHVTAAKALIDNAKFSPSVKEELLALVNDKANSLSCNTDKETESYKNLVEDHKVALLKIEDLESKLTTVFNHYGDNNGSFDDWFSTLVDSDSKNTSREVRTIENPSVVNKDTTVNIACDKLGKYERAIVDSYLNLLNNNGADAAERFLASKRRYLPRGFHPRKFIGD